MLLHPFPALSIFLLLLIQPLLGASFGSGFLISKTGHIATCAHCIPPGAKIAVLTHDGFSHPAIVVFRNDTIDLACLKIEAKIEEAFPIADSDAAKILDEVYVFGFPLPSSIGSELSASKGSLNAKRNQGGVQLLQVDAPVNPGNSGGPVLNDKGAILGVAVSKLDPLKAIKSIGTIPERINFAVPSSVLRAELQRNKIAFQESAEKRDFDAMRAHAAKATVQIIAVSDAPPPKPGAIASKPADQALLSLTRQAAMNYVLLGNSPSLEAEISIYGPKVDYFEQGMRDLAFIRKDTQSLRSRWPERYYVVESVDQVGVEADKQIGTATVHFRFSLFKGDKFYKGKADTFLIFDLSGKNPKTILVREHKTRKQKG